MRYAEKIILAGLVVLWVGIWLVSGSIIVETPLMEYAPASMLRAWLQLPRLNLPTQYVVLPTLTGFVLIILGAVALPVAYVANKRNQR